jgi:hypothetical protein
MCVWHSPRWAASAAEQMAREKAKKLLVAVQQQALARLPHHLITKRIRLLVKRVRGQPLLVRCHTRIE